MLRNGGVLVVRPGSDQLTHIWEHVVGLARRAAGLRNTPSGSDFGQAAR